MTSYEEVELLGDLVDLAGEQAPPTRRDALERQVVDLQHNIHPLTRLPLAGRVDRDWSPDDPHDLPLRCGSCTALEPGRWLKCSRGPNNHHASTDVEPWWPACLLYAPTPQKGPTS